MAQGGARRSVPQPEGVAERNDDSLMDSIDELARMADRLIDDLEAGAPAGAPVDAGDPLALFEESEEPAAPVAAAPASRASEPSDELSFGDLAEEVSPLLSPPPDIDELTLSPESSEELEAPEDMVLRPAELESAPDDGRSASMKQALDELDELLGEPAARPPRARKIEVAGDGGEDIQAHLDSLLEGEASRAAAAAPAAPAAAQPKPTPIAASSTSRRAAIDASAPAEDAVPVAAGDSETPFEVLGNATPIPVAGSSTPGPAAIEAATSAPVRAEAPVVAGAPDEPKTPVAGSSKARPAANVLKGEGSVATGESSKPLELREKTAATGTPARSTSESSVPAPVKAEVPVVPGDSETPLGMLEKAIDRSMDGSRSSRTEPVPEVIRERGGLGWFGITAALLVLGALAAAGWWYFIGPGSQGAPTATTPQQPVVFSKERVYDRDAPRTVPGDASGAGSASSTVPSERTPAETAGPATPASIIGPLLEPVRSRPPAASEASRSSDRAPGAREGSRHAERTNAAGAEPRRENPPSNAKTTNERTTKVTTTEVTTGHELPASQTPAPPKSESRTKVENEPAADLPASQALASPKSESRTKIENMPAADLPASQALAPPRSTIERGTAAAPSTPLPLVAPGSSTNGEAEPPILVQRDEPALPEGALEPGRSVTLRFRVLVGASGRVERVVLVDEPTGSALESAAVTAILGWHYTPAREEGRPVAQWTAERITFEQPGP